MATGNHDGDVYREIMRGAGSVQETEQERLAQQGEAYPRLTTWTLDTLGIGSGTTVLELGCGDGLLLAAAAERVGPTGRVVGVDRDARLIATARARLTEYPWAEAIEGDALVYPMETGSFDAVHCRLVLMHQRGRTPSSSA